MLTAVHIREPERVLRLYPHELSGGMCQRVVISIAFSCEPKLIIADEPTTALDVTVQHQILRLIRELQRKTGTSVLFITHDLGVVAKICDAVSVIHAGRILESGPVGQIFSAHHHPYTEALLNAAPRYDRPENALHPIPPELRERLARETADYDKAHAHA
jgi:peptide/nickel transport system ATP-binding protein